MKSNIKSALLCAGLIVLSAVIMRYGRGGAYAPSSDYSYADAAKEVFYMYGESSGEPQAINPAAANAVLSALEVPDGAGETLDADGNIPVNESGICSEDGSVEKGSENGAPDSKVKDASGDSVVLPPVLKAPASESLEVSGGR